MQGKERTAYTAVGRLRTKTSRDGNTCPSVYVNRQEHLLDLQEMLVWSILSWRVMGLYRIREYYDTVAHDLLLAEQRPLEDCLVRLETRGLIAIGHGDTDIDAIYDMLAGLYIVPVSQNLFLRFMLFLKLLFALGTPISKAKQVLHRAKLGEDEERVMALVNQAMLSTAELVKCVELGITDLSTDEKIMEALYDDLDTTSDNIGAAMRTSTSCAPVTRTITNLCLHKKIIFDRV